jgi:ribosomal protein L39E
MAFFLGFLKSSKVAELWCIALNFVNTDIAQKFAHPGLKKNCTWEGSKVKKVADFLDETVRIPTWIQILTRQTIRYCRHFNVWRALKCKNQVTSPAGFIDLKLSKIRNWLAWLCSHTSHLNRKQFIKDTYVGTVTDPDST